MAKINKELIIKNEGTWNLLFLKKNNKYLFLVEFVLKLWERTISKAKNTFKKAIPKSNILCIWDFGE